MLYSYDKTELAFLKETIAAYDSTLLMDACLKIIGKNRRKDIYENCITLDNKVIFKEEKKYFIVEQTLAANGKVIRTACSDFDPFEQMDNNFSDYRVIRNNTIFSVYEQESNKIVLTHKQLFESFNSFEIKSICSHAAATFVASCIAAALNAQQEWYHLLKADVIPVCYQAVLDRKEIEEFCGNNLLDSTSQVNAYVQTVATRIGHHLTKIFYNFDKCVELSCSAKRGWDIFSYEVINNTTFIYCLGDARVLDFELRRLNAKQSKDQESEET